MSMTNRYVSSTGSATYAASISSATPMSLVTAFASCTAGDIINIKADGAYTFSSTNTITNGGNTTDPVIFRGYKTTPGDGYLGRTNGNGALITTNMPSITWTGCNHEWSDHCVIETLNLSTSANLASTTNGNAGDGFGFFNFSTTVFYDSCKITNTGGGGCAVQTANGATVNCDMSTSGTDGNQALSVAGAQHRVIGCRITGGAAPAILSGLQTQLLFNTLYRSTYGFYATLGANSGQMTIVGNTLVNNTSDGLLLTGTSTSYSAVLINNMSTDNGGYGFNIGGGGNCISFLSNNRTRNNTSGPSSLSDWGTNAQYGSITSGSTTDYVNAASDDYRLLITSPAYQAGLPLYRSIGANTPQAAGGGGIMIASGFDGGFPG